MRYHEIYEDASRSINITDTDAFKKWFSGSKAVDAQGQPKVAYHGTPDVRGIISKGFERSMMRGDVYFFTDDYTIANSYADPHRAFDFQGAEPHVVPVYLSLRNPLMIDAKGEKWRETEKHINSAKEQGYDGVIIKNSRDEYNNIKSGGKKSTVYAVFSPKQIKSALTAPLKSRIDGVDIGGGPNKGSFNPDNDHFMEKIEPQNIINNPAFNNGNWSQETTHVSENNNE